MPIPHNRIPIRIKASGSAFARHRARLAPYYERVRRWLPLSLMVMGLFLLGYVGSEYYSMFREQKRLHAAWDQQNAAPRNVAAAAPHDDLMRVQIERIGLDAIVLEGTARKQLKVGPGRIIASALPGEAGNAVITAHRDTFFRHIYELGKGDPIIVRRNGEILTFAVTGKKVVSPDDLSVLKATADPTLTLITCYPTYYIGPAPERLVVTAKLASRAPEPPAIAQK